MKWFHRKAAPLPIPPYTPPPIEAKREHAPKDEGIVVQEHSWEDLGMDPERATRTGMQRAWDRVTKKFRVD